MPVTTDSSVAGMDHPVETFVKIGYASFKEIGSPSSTWWRGRDLAGLFRNGLDMNTPRGLRVGNEAGR